MAAEHEVDEKIINKIRRMLSLKDSANEHEAANALAKAEMFLAMHNLTMEAVQSVATEEIYGYVEAKTGRAFWRRQLLGVIAKYNFCYVVHLSGTDICALVGSKTNQQAVLAMYNTVVEQVTRIGRRERLYEGQGNPRRWLNGFYHGAVDTINLRLKEAQDRMLTVKQPTPAPEPHSEDIHIHQPRPEYDQETEPTPEPEQVRSLLVLTDEKIEKSVKKHFPKLIFPKRKRKLLLSAYEHGIQSGYTIALSGGLLEEPK